MSSDYPDVGNLFGYDPYDVLGLDEYLKNKEEESKIDIFGNLPFAGSLGVQEPGPLPTGEGIGYHPEAQISPGEPPSVLDKVKDLISSLLGQDPDEMRTREATQIIARREEMAKEQAQFNKDVREHGLLGARIPGAHPEVPTPLDAITGILMSMPGGMGRGSFESRNLIGDMRGERADFLKSERTKPIPSEPVVEAPSRIPTPEGGYPTEDLTAAMEITPQERMRNDITGVIASGKGVFEGTTPPESSISSAQAHIRLDALLNELAPTLGPHAAEILNAPELKGLGFQYLPGVAGRYGDKGKVFYDPIELAGRTPSNKEFADYVKYAIEHELSHAESPNLEGKGVGHALPSANEATNRVGGIEGELFGEREAIPALMEGEAKIGLPKEAWEHTRKGGEIRSAADAIENIFTGRRNILEHDPYTQHLLSQLRKNVEEANLYEALTGKVPTKTEEVSDLTRSMEFTPEQVKARERMEAQLAREEAQRKRDSEIDKLIQTGRDAKLAGNVEEANRINAQVLELRNAPLPEIPPKPEVTTFREPEKPTAEQMIQKAVEAEKAKPIEKVEETPPSEKVVSAPANILRKLLEETKLTRFNVSTLKETLKAKGIELPAEVEREVPNLVKELKDRGWLQEKLGGTYTLLAGPPKTMKGISGKKPMETTNIKESLEKTIEATKPAPKTGIEPSEQVIDTTPTPGLAPKVKAAEGKIMEGLSDASLQRLNKTLPEGSQGKIDVEKEIARRAEIPTKEVVPAGKVPNLTEQMKAKLTPDELAAIGKLFGTETKPKKGTKEVPEEVRLAQQAAIRGLAEKETKKAEGKGPSIPEELGEVAEGGGKQRPYEVTLNDGTTHIVRAATPEEARTKAEGVLEEYGSTKVVDKIEEHLGTLEKAAKYEIEPVKTGSEAVSEELKETKKSVSEEVKETARLGREEERLRKAQTKEKFQAKPYNVSLSNGRTVVVKARNEKIAREIAESRIKKLGSGVTVESVGLKPSALESAITGGARKLEESGFLQNPIVRMFNAVKSLAFGGDVGHLLRQGKQMNADLLFSKHAGKLLKQFPELIKLAKGENYLNELNERLYSDPDIKALIDNFGLDMPGLGKGFKEEVFHGGGLAEELPVIGKYYAKPSERIYTGGLNYLRAAEAKKLVESLRKDGFTPDNAPEKYHAVARAVNIISQRGHFQPAYQKLFSDASVAFGAPRAKAARVQNVFELFRGGTSGRIVRTTAAKTLAFNLGLFGLLKTTLGATFVTDSESSDYGKIRVSPKITVDPWMGLGVTARTAAKLIHGKAKSPYTGKGYPVSPSDALMNEFLGGIAPGVKLAWEAMSGTDLRGYQVDRLSSLLNVTPLTARSVGELLKEGDVDEALLLSILQAGGEGIDVFDYEKERAKQKKLRQERGLSTKGSKGVSLPF